jgi:hypothetical protein
LIDAGAVIDAVALVPTPVPVAAVVDPVGAPPTATAEPGEDGKGDVGTLRGSDATTLPLLLV